jgi:hypothetical protein
MRYYKESPASLAADRAPNSSLCLAACDGSEHSLTQPEIQAFRVAWIARRTRLPLSVAATIAHLAGLGPMEARQ